MNVLLELNQEKKWNDYNDNKITVLFTFLII